MRSTVQSPGSSPALAAILKAIRRRRGLRSAEVARAMNLPLRSYQHFEAGGGRLNPVLVHRFAKAVDADGFAILIALQITSEAFAIHCMDNKLATILLGALQDFETRAQADVGRLDRRFLIQVFTRAFDDLLAKAREDDAYVERWMLETGKETPPPEEDES